MATAWITSGVGWGFILLGWWMSPAISFLLNKFFSYLDFHTSRKLRDLEIDTIPKLKQTLRDAEEQRMMREAEAKVPRSDLTILDKIMKDLKDALHEAEDILDLVDYHQIEKRATGHGPTGACISRHKRRCLDQWRCIASRANLLGAAAGAWISRCKTCFRPLIESATRNSSSADAVSTPRPVLELSVAIDALDGPAELSCAGAVSLRPVLTAESASSADAISIAEEVSTTILNAGEVCSAESVPRSDRSITTSSAESVSTVRKLRFRWSIDLVPLGIRCYRCILTYLSNAVTRLLYYRDWSNEAFGVSNYQEDDMALDSFLRTVSRMWLRKRLQQIEDILNDSTKSHLLNQQSNNSKNSVRDEIRRIHINTVRKVFGREKERDDICNMLRDGPSSNEDKHYCVIGIHGIAGSGKSTLAQYVCDYENELKDNDKHFDLVMFVNVSSSSSIFHGMLEQMRKQQPSDGKIEDELKKQLTGKCFLLVLDDLWVNKKNCEQLGDLRAVLNCGKIGSGVLVTAQREDAARVLDAEKLIAISDLEKEHYFSLFMHHALQVTGSFDDREHREIGEMIAEKLHSSPIAAVTVAARLRMNPDIRFWKRTANLDMLKETRGALWWSYQQLDADIRRCFAYFSTFPRGYKLLRDELVRLWVAQGFIKTSNEEYEVEDLGQDYFYQLLAFSFLQPQRRKYGPEYFTIHDLLHGLAEDVSRSDFFRIVSDGPPRDMPPGVRHLFIEATNGAEIAEKSQGLGNLRTLIIEDTGRHKVEIPLRNHDLEKVLERLFMRLRKLRVLIIKVNRKTRLLSFPASIDRMKHLRYICFSPQVASAGLILPSTFSKLYHMQTIDVPLHCEVSCPEDMASLIRLRHIRGRLLFPNVGRLTSLQTMTDFYVTMNKEQGYELKQLKDLNKLRGTLRIWGLENVGSKEEALGAQLASKTGVTELSLCFFGWTTKDPELEAEVLDGLCPPKDLLELSIFGYKGSRYPSWILSRHHPYAPKHLSKLELGSCSRLASIPGGCEFFSRLRELSIKCCSRDSLPENMERLVSLQSLSISGYGCDKMMILPTLPRSLEKISINRPRLQLQVTTIGFSSSD